MVDRLVRGRLVRSKTSALLLGPRQVGKSTLCRTLSPIRTINLADESQFLRYSKDPARLRHELASSDGGLVVVDEVQRAPALLNTLQLILDEPGNRYRFVLTGSSARKLKRGGACRRESGSSCSTWE